MGKKILMVDDDQELVESVTTVLKTAGYEVISAKNGTIGFEKAKTENPDLVLLDVMMTDRIEGFTVARNLKKHEATRAIPIVIITGIKKEMNLPFGFETDEEWLPVKTVLEKPFTPDLLLKTIKENLS